jgi:hypothetical protein
VIDCLTKSSIESYQIYKERVIQKGTGGKNFHFTAIYVERKSKYLSQDMLSLESLMNAEGSYKAYRAYLHKANPPQIPYMYVSFSTTGGEALFKLKF